jgi:hypothetical protein
MTTDEKNTKKLNHEEKVKETRELAKIGQKHCRICDRILSLDDFPIHNSKSLTERGWGDGHCTRCKDCSREYHKKYKDGRKINNRVNYLKQYAKKAGEPCEITVKYMEDLYQEQKGLCKISQLPMTWDPHSPDTATITRFDSKIPFLKGNVVWCRAYINTALIRLSYEMYLECNRSLDQNRLPLDDIYLRKRPNDRFHLIKRNVRGDKGNDANDQNTP